MSSITGKNIKISVFGESHGEMIGATIDGLPAGFKIDLEKIRFFLNRRKPGKKNTTPRNENDDFEIVSGFFNGYTTGAPLTIIIRNTDKRSKDYKDIKQKPRPSHSDYTAFIKYKGFADYRGGGHFSGRLTATICAVGNVVLQILESKKIYIFSHIKQLHHIKDVKIEDTTIEEQKEIQQKEIAFLNDKNIELANAKISEIVEKGDSIGGQIETIVHNVGVGFGSPIFDSIESKISSMMFSIPAVKGVEFGNGFDCSNLLGSENNDEFKFQDGKIITKTNNSGGINGGISNGMPIVFNIAIKPTSSISKEQNTVNLDSKLNDKLKVEGRHDPAIILRAVPVVEAMTAIAIYDILLEKNYEFDRS